MGKFCEAFLVVICLGFGFCCPYFRGDDYKKVQRPPKTLISSTPDHIKFYNGNYSIVIDGVGIEIRLDCWAPYPIDVRFKGHLANRGATVGLIERRVQDPKDISTYCFNINVTLTAYEEITGEYSCVSIENDKIGSAHYIYHAAHPPETLLNRNSTIRALMKKNEEWTILPCPTSNPHVQVNLYKNVNGDFQKVQGDENILRYNPRVGFSLLTVLIEPNLIHKFRCSTELSDLDSVDIVLYPPKLVIPKPSEKNLVVSEGDQITVSCEASQEILFENSNKAIEEAAVVIRPSNQSEDKIYSYTTPVLRKGDSGVISCISALTTEPLFEWSFRTIKKEVPATKEQARQLHDHNHSLNSYECKLPTGDMKIALHECNNWVECNLRKCNQLDRKCVSVRCDEAKTSNCIQSGVIQCFNANGESAQTQIFFSGLQNKKTYTFWKTAPKQSILKIRKYAKSHGPKNTTLKTESKIAENFEVELACDGSAFVFAVGFKWYLTSQNNATQILVPEEKVTHTWKHLEDKNVLRSILKMNITDNISQVICKAPIWNSTEWREDAYSISQYHQFNDGSKTRRGTRSSRGASLQQNMSTSVFFIEILLTSPIIFTYYLSH